MGKEAVLPSPRMKVFLEFSNPPGNGLDPNGVEHIVRKGFMPIDVWHTINHPLSVKESPELINRTPQSSFDVLEDFAIGFALIFPMESVTSKRYDGGTFPGRWGPEYSVHIAVLGCIPEWLVLVAGVGTCRVFGVIPEWLVHVAGMKNQISTLV